MTPNRDVACATIVTMPARWVMGILPGVVLFLLAAAGESLAQVTRSEIRVVESPALGGEHFGAIGAYERLRGTLQGEIDPADPRHRGIVHLESAPRNERGRVEYSTVVEIYRPVDMRRWNGAFHHTVPNRGRPQAPDGALLERGFAFVMVGWQGDLVPTETNIVAALPAATNPDGSPIVGTALEEFIFGDNEAVSTARLTYPAASLDPGRASLTVRGTQAAPRSTPAELHWSYEDQSRIRIERPAGFDGGAIYEFVYEAHDPIVMGLGFAAMRDAISFFRYETADRAGNGNPLFFDGLAGTVLSVGISQSGRYLRDFLYQGFNEDIEARIVFDGMHPNIAGSRKTFTNYEFGQPGRWQKQHEDHLFPGDQFPFTYSTLADPVSGRTDGLLQRCRATGTCPKIIHTDGEAELWQARASLVVTGPLGGDIEIPGNVRAYLLAGTEHGGGGGVHAESPTPGICQNLRNPMDLGQIRTALTVALHEWVEDGVDPPPSRFPTVAGDGLRHAADIGFPGIPGVTYSGSYNPLRFLDHRSIPPEEGDSYTVLVGRVDADGNMIGGVRHPNLAVPVGTYTGWNLRRQGFGEGGQCAGAGSFIPFAATAAARRASGDPRLSIEERYPTRDAYVAAVSREAQALVEERFLLPSDAAEIVERARMSSVGRER